MNVTVIMLTCGAECMMGAEGCICRREGGPWGLNSGGMAGVGMMPSPWRGGSMPARLK